MAYFVLCSETGFLCVIEPCLSWSGPADQADLELTVCLPLPPERWGLHAWPGHCLFSAMTSALRGPRQSLSVSEASTCCSDYWACAEGPGPCSLSYCVRGVGVVVGVGWGVRCLSVMWQPVPAGTLPPPDTPAQPRLPRKKRESWKPSKRQPLPSREDSSPPEQAGARAHLPGILLPLPFRKGGHSPASRPPYCCGNCTARQSCSASWVFPAELRPARPVMPCRGRPPPRN